MSNITDNPIIGTLILFIILYFLFYVNNYNIIQILSPNNFNLIFREAPWIIYLALSISLYAGYSIYTHC